MKQQEGQTQAGNAPQRIPGAAYVLTGCVGVIGANSLVLGPIAPAVSVSFHSTVAGVMMATAAFGLGAAFSSLFLAPRIDRFGAHRMLCLAMMLLPLVLLLAAAAPGVLVLVLAQFLAGLASGVALPAVYASAANMAPPGLESKTIGVVLAGWTLGMVGGVSLSAIVADLTHWRVVYGLVAVLGFCVRFLLARRAGVNEAPAAQSAPTPLSALVLPGIKPLLFACCAFMVAFYGLYAYLGAYFHNGLGKPVSANSLITLMYSIGFASGIFTGARIVARVGVSRMLAIALFMVAASYMLMGALGSSFTAMLMLLIALGFSNYFGINLLIVRLTSIDPTKRGTIMGLHSTVTNLAVFAGTGSFGLIYAQNGFAPIAYTAMACTLAAALTVTVAR